MTKRKAWLTVFIGSALFWGGCIFVGHALAAQPTEDVTVVPKIEFNCKGIKEVIFMEDGTLIAGGKIYKLSHGYDNKLVFSGGAMIEGELDGDNLYFDQSTLRVGGQSYSCRAE